MLRVRNFMCTSLAAVFAFIAVSTVTPCCPVMFYQPELPRRD